MLPETDASLNMLSPLRPPDRKPEPLAINLSSSRHNPQVEATPSSRFPFSAAAPPARGTAPVVPHVAWRPTPWKCTTATGTGSLLLLLQRLLFSPFQPNSIVHHLLNLLVTERFHTDRLGWLAEALRGFYFSP